MMLIFVDTKNNFVAIRWMFFFDRFDSILLKLDQNVADWWINNLH